MFKLCEQNESTFTASFTQTALTMALVLATAGMIFFTTPNASMYVTPSMPNFSPRSRARSYTHFMSPGESASSLRSGNSRGHCKTRRVANDRGGDAGQDAPDCVPGEFIFRRRFYSHKGGSGSFRWKFFGLARVK